MMKYGITPHKIGDGYYGSHGSATVRTLPRVSTETRTRVGGITCIITLVAIRPRPRWTREMDVTM